jgi:(2Fe-2S) ferredoxin
MEHRTQPENTMPKPSKHVFACVQGRPAGHPRGSCQDKGCAAVWQKLSDEFTVRNLWAAGFQLTNSGCLGPCQAGPAVLVYPEGVMYAGVGPGDIDRIIEEHLILDRPVAELQAPAELWG